MTAELRLVVVSMVPRDDTGTGVNVGASTSDGEGVAASVGAGVSGVRVWIPGVGEGV